MRRRRSQVRQVLACARQCGRQAQVCPGPTKQAVIEEIGVHSAEALRGEQLTHGSRGIRRTAPSVDDVTVESFLDRWMSVHRARIRTSTATRYVGPIRNHLAPVVHNQAGPMERRRDPVLDHAGHLAVLVDGSARTPRRLRPWRTSRLCTNDPPLGGCSGRPRPSGTA